MHEDVQSKVMQSWDQVNTDNVSDLARYWDNLYHMLVSILTMSTIARILL